MTAASDVAAAKLASSLPRRWTHVRAVARKADSVRRVTREPETLVAAAWLHDVGYAPDIVDTGLHSLDGARWLLREGWVAEIAGLVANHSCALYEAQERGLGEILSREFPRQRSATADALWFADPSALPNYHRRGFRTFKTESGERT